MAHIKYVFNITSCRTGRSADIRSDSIQGGYRYVPHTGGTPPLWSGEEKALEKVEVGPAAGSVEGAQVGPPAAAREPPPQRDGSHGLPARIRGASSAALGPLRVLWQLQAPSG